MTDNKKNKQRSLKGYFLSIILSLALVALINLGTSFELKPVLAKKEAPLKEEKSEKPNTEVSEGPNTEVSDEKKEKENSEKVEEKEVQQENGTYKDGEYLGTGEGYNGPIQVKVLVEKGEISQVNIVYTTDDKEYLDAAEQVIDDVISQQDTDVQAVSGATCTAYGILDAIDQSLDIGE